MAQTNSPQVSLRNTTIPAMVPVLWPIRPESQPVGQGEDPQLSKMSWRPRPDEVDSWEQWTGSDWSMAVSPDERFQWYSDPRYGYGEAEHQQYIKDAESLLDVPLIPRGAAFRMGFLGPGTGDVTPREFLAAAPAIRMQQAKMRAMRNPDDPEAQRELAAAVAEGEPVFRQMIVGELPSFEESPAGRAAWAELTGQVYDRNTAGYAGDVARSMIDAIGAGRTNSMYETDPSISQQDHDALVAKYGSEAHRMLTPGGVENARREAAYDFFGALQNGQRYTPHIDNMSAILAAVGHTGSQGDMQMDKFSQADMGDTRWSTLMDHSALRGRMKLASNRLRGAMGSFADQQQSPEKPYVMTASNFNRTDPASFMGLYNLAGNSSWGYGRNIQNPYEPVMGELLTRAYLADGLDDRPLEFFQDTNDRVFREAPVRPEYLSPRDFADTRRFAMDRRNSNLPYWSSFGPRVADAYNNATLQGKSNPSMNPFPPMERTYPSPAMDVFYQLAPNVGRSAAQSAMIGASALPSMAGRGAVGATEVAAGLLKEVPEEWMEDAAVDPKEATGMFQGREENAWIRPYRPGIAVPGKDGVPTQRTRAEYERMLDPRNKEDWEQSVRETNEQRTRELEDQYLRWQLGNQPKQEASGYRGGFRPLLLN